MFFKSVPKFVVIASSVVAIVVHFSFYYGKIGVPFTDATGENPGVAAAVAIILSVITGIILYLITGKKSNA